ncbi:hypothetical protein GP486_006468 [Trichoglossum hirsutum]|uniref:Calpain catalytic domain-containing protein n=1 Tax=Trichoglossum hirsutum TaxID=265104 RepID=A0A9P8L7T2_9PEZI|nr:hypothetical protein GP486_006468 [Trichoglossum hirsutum]
MTPQQLLEAFWDDFITKAPGKVTSIFPHSLYANLLPPEHLRRSAVNHNAAESYKAAAEECRKKVQRIAEECRRTNEKFTDPDFDVEDDFGCGDCLHGLPWSNDDDSEGSIFSVDRLRTCLDVLVSSKVLESESTRVNVSALKKCLDDSQRDESWDGPKSVHRVDYIYKKPAFCIDGYSTDDVRQGAIGDCWWVSAVATLCCMEGLMDRVCVARDEKCGVYGFVFFRDGEWFSTVVDDNLYLVHEDYTSDMYDNSGEEEREYRMSFQTGSGALYFAHCADKNETWLPLLEKAYAKVHGDYDAIGGGVSGEAVEDMTGGVTTNLLTNKVLDKDKLWQELLGANKEFVFAALSPSSNAEGMRGLTPGHSYSILKATEESDEDGNKFRLVLIRNPWGRRSRSGLGEWTGPWSDGSKEWTPYWMQKLNHMFGDDGRFWMLYDDLLCYFKCLDRTRLFNEDWTVVQLWTHVNVSWITGYHNTKFLVEVQEQGPTIFVLSQLDSRYFEGLEGQYTFELHFILQEKDAPMGEHIVRARGTASGGGRSVSTEVELKPGRYEVLPKILASRDPDEDAVEDVVKKWAEKKPQKLRQIGLNYDLAHAKGCFDDETMKRPPCKSGGEEDGSPAKEEKRSAKVKRWLRGRVKEKRKKENNTAVGQSRPSSPTPSETSDNGDVEAQGRSTPYQDSDADSAVKPWNAICTIGLRVYSRNLGVSIKLARPQDAEEGAALASDGLTPAGATM